MLGAENEQLTLKQILPGMKEMGCEYKGIKHGKGLWHSDRNVLDVTPNGHIQCSI